MEQYNLDRQRWTLHRGPGSTPLLEDMLDAMESTLESHGFSRADLKIT